MTKLSLRGIIKKQSKKDSVNQKEDEKHVKGKIMKEQKYKMGQAYWVYLGRQEGSVQGGWHPAIIVQNNIGNKFSRTISVVPTTSRKTKAKLPTHVMIQGGKFGFSRDSIVQCEGQRPVDKSDIGGYIGTVDDQTMGEIARACLINTPFLLFLDGNYDFEGAVAC